MTSSFSTNKGFEEPASGDYVNAWATPVNANWTAIDAALGGTTSISVTGISAPTTTLTLAQYRPPNIEFTGTLAANLNYQIPTGVGGMWSINNGTSGAFTLSFSIAAGNALTLPPGRTLIISDGATVALADQAPQGGTYSPTFQSGSVQVAGPNGRPVGYGDFQFGFALPNASGTPLSGLLLGGAGKTQVVYITDAQVPGLPGITVIRSAGDAGDSTSTGGSLLDFAGASVNGQGGAAIYQAGTSVNATAGDATLQGGNATGTNPNAQAGNAVVSSGVVGQKCGIGVILSANIPPGATGNAVIRHQFGTVGGTILTVDEALDGSLFLYPLAAFPSVTRGGYGVAGQSLVSGGPGQPTYWAGGNSLSTPGYEILPGGTILQWGGVTTPVVPNPVDFNITFPKVFPTACFGVFVCSNRNVATNGQAIDGSNYASNITTTGATITVDQGTFGHPSSWFAIGR